MIVIGSRGSALARVQSQNIADQLSRAGHPARLEIIRTRGDAIVDRPFTQIPGKGFFTEEIEAALRKGTVDLAVHSLKDLPTEDAPELAVVAVPPREDPCDCLLVAPASFRPEAAGLPLPQGARVGTSAVRRAAQLLALRPDLRVESLRGNVPTRLRRLQEGHFAAIVLAQAGLNRLNLPLGEMLALPLPVTQFVPAPGQGALALQAHRQRADLLCLCRQLLHDEETAAQVGAERAVLARVEGGCHAPLGAYASGPVGQLQMRLFYARPGTPAPLQTCVEASAYEGLCLAAFAALQGA